MRLELLIHLDRVPEGNPHFVWWAESDDVPGFSSAADHLPDLLCKATEALRSHFPDEAIDIVPKFNSAQSEVDLDERGPIELLDGLELRNSITLMSVPA